MATTLPTPVYRLLRVSGALVALVGAAACDLTTSPEPPPTVAPNPLRGARLYVDPYSAASKQVVAWADTRPGDAALIARIAQQPQAVWLGAWTRDPAETVRTVQAEAARTGTVPVYAIYNIPKLDCVPGLGARDGAAYRNWVRSVAAALEGSGAVVILEPDALGLLTDCLTDTQQRERLDLMAAATDLLVEAGTTVYIDAGTAGWVRPQVMAVRLESAGIARARGFAVNVSNFVDTGTSVAYAENVAQWLDEPAYVIDTSRNGLGSNGEWCNPSGRALGEPPRIVTDAGRLDALLWIKRPGESDGTCNGGPPAGTWWPDYALGLARRATWTR